MRPMIRAAGLIGLAILLISGGRGALAAEKPSVYTVNYPLAYFAERIAGDLVVVRFPAPLDVDPAFWMPDPETIAAYQAADLILLNGADYAKWLKTVSLPMSRMVDTSRAYKDQYIQQASLTTHSHGPGGQHSHGGTAFTTWLDLDQAVQQARAIKDALVRSLPGHEAGLTKNFGILERELLDLDARLREIAERDPGRPLVASHPVYQYLARRYGLNLKSLMWEPDELPSESQWSELATILAGHPAKWMLWEGEPAEESVARLRALGVESIVFSPCANRPAPDDFLSVMERNLAGLERVFE